MKYDNRLNVGFWEGVCRKPVWFMWVVMGKVGFCTRRCLSVFVQLFYVV